jgi:hypothetical protein
VSFCQSKGLFDVCNPITHQRAPLPLLREQNLPTRRIQIAAFYQHQPSGEYRVLYSIWTKNGDTLTLNVDFYVLVVGSGEPRPIGQLPVFPELLRGLTCSYNAPILYHGSLHWKLRQYLYDPSHNIMVFDTVFETFRWMRRPSGSYTWMSLLEMNNTLAMGCTQGWIVIDIYVMHDYAAEVWAFTHRINILELEGLPSLDYGNISVLKIVALNDRELLIELLGGPIFQCDIDGKFLGNIECEEVEENIMHITPYRFRENIVPLPFFDTEDDSRNNMILKERDGDMRYSIWP